MKKEIYDEKASIFKVLSDANRLQILDMLSCGEMCACEILEKFKITQPTLSHHMKVLLENNLVSARKEGNWTHYTLNKTKMSEIAEFVNTISSDKKDCICKNK